MKAKVKQKLKEIRQHVNRTGNEPTTIVLTDLEEKIVSIWGKKSLDGDENLEELGFPLAQNNRKDIHFLCRINHSH